MPVPKSVSQNNAHMSNHQRLRALQLTEEIDTLIHEADPRGRALIRQMVETREAALDLHHQNDLVKKSESVQFARAMAKGMRDDPERWFGKACSS
jgi:hypothetical protein